MLGIEKDIQIRRGENIKEWTGMDFASSTRAAEAWTRWKGIFVVILWSPNDLARLWHLLDYTKICLKNISYSS